MTKIGTYVTYTCNHCHQGVSRKRALRCANCNRLMCEKDFIGGSCPACLELLPPEDKQKLLKKQKTIAIFEKVILSSCVISFIAVFVFLFAFMDNSELQNIALPFGVIMVVSMCLTYCSGPFTDSNRAAAKAFQRLPMEKRQPQLNVGPVDLDPELRKQILVMLQAIGPEKTIQMVSAELAKSGLPIPNALQMATAFVQEAQKGG